jgi:hypothetical protein
MDMFTSFINDTALREIKRRVVDIPGLISRRTQ